MADNPANNKPSEYAEKYQWGGRGVCPSCCAPEDYERHHSGCEVMDAINGIRAMEAALDRATRERDESRREHLKTQELHNNDKKCLKTYQDEFLKVVEERNSEKLKRTSAESQLEEIRGAIVTLLKQVPYAR